MKTYYLNIVRVVQFKAKNDGEVQDVAQRLAAGDETINLITVTDENRNIVAEVD